MRTIWRSLIWKEWHEHKWKLAALAAILCGVSAIAMLATADERNDDFVAFMMLGYVIVPLALFLGAKDAADERGRGTEPFLQSLPVPPWQTAIWKLVFGITTCILPIFAALALLSAMTYLLPAQGVDLARELERGRDGFATLVALDHVIVEWVVSVGIYASIAGVSVYLWTLAFGVGAKDEVRAGAWALLAIVAWWSVVGFVVINYTTPQMTLAINLLSTAPGGLALALAIVLERGDKLAISIPVLVAINTVIHVALAAWFVCRFGRSSELDRFSPNTARNGADAVRWIGPPRRHPLTAIVWKQFRESTPIVLAGLAAISFFFIGNLVSDLEYYSKYRAERLTLLTQLTMSFGFLVALVVGVGVFDRDLEPRVNQFWRSRPIHPDIWFWVKFATGLGVLLGALYLPIVVASLWSSVPMERMGPGARMMFCLQVTVYTSAMAMICLIRQPVYAAILGCGTMLIGVSIVLYFFGPQTLEVDGTVLAIEIVTATLATIIAWSAVRYDWGSKG